MAELLRETAGYYVESYPRQAVPQVQSTLAKLTLCRTAALGERHYQCSKCGVESFVYHSCGDRHCPTCSGAKRLDWMDASGQLILPGVDYYQVVFTLPDRLSRLSLGNRREIYDLLFRSAWSALKQVIRGEQGYDPAALMVLHTWNQKLDAHAHVHAVVPGGGPSLKDGQWRVSQKPGEPDSAGKYLVDAAALKRKYRDEFLRELRRLHAAGKLKLEEEFAELQTPGGWDGWMEDLAGCEWVAHIEPPPAPGSRVEDVLKYLARYLTGGPISDSRILSADSQTVTFWAREGTVSGGEAEQVPVTLTTLEFTRRWSLHILPSGYTKTRRFGGFSNTRCRKYLQACVIALSASRIDPASERAASESDSSEFTPLIETWYTACACRAPLILQGDLHRRSWRDVMRSSDRPSWYRRL